MTLVSIITPSFNQALYLEQTLRSVLDQDHPDLEYIVIDGGSTDGSLDVLKKYASRLAYWVSEPDSGQAEAINKGMQHAHGQFVAWLNSDDYYLPGALRAAVAAFERSPEAAMVYGDMQAVDQNGDLINEFKYRQVSVEDLLAFEILGQPAVFMRREAFERAGGLEPSLHFLLDHDLWLRIAAHGPVLHVADMWAAARYHPAAKNRLKAAEFGREAFRILERAANYPSLAGVLGRIGSRARAAAHRVDARYLLDGGLPAASLAAWSRAFALHPPTALARLNLPVSALLDLIGLGSVREAVLRRRQARFRPGR